MTKFQSTNHLLKVFLLLKTVLFYCHRKYQSHNNKISLIKSKPIFQDMTPIAPIALTIACAARTPLLPQSLVRPSIQNSKFRIPPQFKIQFLSLKNM